MSPDSLGEGVDDHVSPLGIINSVPNDESAVIVDEDEGEGARAVDVALDEVEVPHVVRADGLVAALMALFLDLRRSISRLLHDASNGIDADLDALSAELVSNLAGAEARVSLPDVEDLLVPLGFDVRGVWPRRRGVTLPFGSESNLASPLVDREASHPELLARSRDPDFGRALKGTGLL